MIQSKNLKLKLGLCGLALTSFLALNVRGNTVHADTVDANNNANQNAITWGSDQDDSQVVKEEPQQDNASQSAQKQVNGQADVQIKQASATQNVQTQGAVQDQKVPAIQSVQPAQKQATVQSNVQNRQSQPNVAVANVSSTPVQQNRAEKSAVRVSNFDTSAVNRNNAQNVRNNANVKVATVHDTAQMPVQKQKVAQFNQDSKIYTLNGSNQLSKNNGDGYVITNAGMYNGRAVDIGVTISGVQDNQGTYTTKWSNGDKADVTGKTDASFKYQDSVLMGQQSVLPDVPNKTRTRYESKAMNCPYTFNFADDDSGGSGRFKTDKYYTDYVYSSLASYHGDYWDTIQSLAKIYASVNDVSFFGPTSNSALDELVRTKANSFGGVKAYTFNWHDPTASDPSTTTRFGAVYVMRNDGSYTYNDLEPVADHLQLASSTPASLGYNYTVGLYDAQTGDLITDLKAEYNSKAGVQATAKDSVMNTAIKSKIQQINQNKATVSYTGTRSNDDVAFYQETRQVNPQDKNVNRQVQRVIHINFPNGKKPASYDSITDSKGNKLTLDSNNNLTQSMSFTRTGVQNIVSGQVTYGNWQQHGSINAVTLPSIPGYTMVTNN